VPRRFRPRRNPCGQRPPLDRDQTETAEGAADSGREREYRQSDRPLEGEHVLTASIRLHLLQFPDTAQQHSDSSFAGGCLGAISLQSALYAFSWI
jgi:hypothetical protein